MKAIVCLIVGILLIHSSFAQQIHSSPNNYFQISRNQKTAGFITLGCGAALFIPGVIKYQRSLREGHDYLNVEGLEGALLALAGTGFLASSVYLFIRSGQNFRKAERISFQLNKPVVINTGVLKKTLPYSVGITVALN